MMVALALAGLQLRAACCGAPPQRLSKRPRVCSPSTCPPPAPQAREYLYWRLHGTQLTTPVAVMTSAAKGNHWRVRQLFEQGDWFGRWVGGVGGRPHGTRERLLCRHSP